MKNLSVNYLNSVKEQSVLSLAMCIKITLKSGRILAFTTNTRDVIFKEQNDLVYKSLGLTPTALATSSQMNVDNLEAELLINHEDISADDMEKGLFNNAEIEIFRFNFFLKPYSYKDIEKLGSGTVGEVKREKNKYKFEYRSKTQNLQTNIVDVTKKTCSAKFGDSKCKKNADDYTFEDEIITTYKNRSFTIKDSDKPDGYFDFGIIEFLTGLATGQKMEIKKWVLSSKTLELTLPMNYKISPGDTFKITAGCDKNKNTCIDKFDNIVNFRGFSFIPGLDKMTGGLAK